MLLAINSCVAWAGFQNWTGTGPRAKSVEAIARDPLNASRLWCATYGAGIYRSTDAGVTWTGHRTGLLNTFARSLAVEPSHPDSVFCGTNDGVYVSTNGGTSWNKVLSTGGSVRSLVIHPIKTGVIFAGTYGDGVYKSFNGGATWSHVTLGLVNTNVRDIALHPTRPETVYVATGTGGGVHRSFNGGLSWAQVPDTAATLGAAEQIQFDRLDPNRIYVAELDRGVIRSLDGGNTWSRINRGLASFRGRSLAVVDTLRYFGTDGSGAYVTSLNDSSWHAVNLGLTNPIVDVLLASPTTPNAVLAGTEGGGIFSTSNRGASWSQLDGGLLSTFGFSVAFNPFTHSLYAGLGFGDQFWHSTDQGVTWSRAVSLAAHESEQGVVADPITPGLVYLSAYGDGVYRSTNDGTTWVKPDLLTLGNHSVRDLVAWPGQTGHLFVATGIGPFESTDGGTTWISRVGNLPASFSTRSLALVPGVPPTLYAGSDSAGLYKSTDGGATWSTKNAGLPSPFIRSVLVRASNSSVVYAATDSGVYRSPNGGASFAPAKTGLPSGDVIALVEDHVHPGAIFGAVDNAGVFETVDDGASWRPVFGQNGLVNRSMRSLAVDGAQWTLYAGTDAGIASVTGYALPVTGVTSTPSTAFTLSAWPNPSRGRRVHLSYSLPRAGAVRLAVFDVTGHRIRLLAEAAGTAGAHVAEWDGRDARGRRLGAGVYFVRLEASGYVREARIAVLGD